MLFKCKLPHYTFPDLSDKIYEEILARFNDTFHIVLNVK